MKVIITTIVLSFVLSCSTTKIVNNSKNGTFKTITEASYSAKRSGELTRNEALNQKVSRKEIYDEKGVIIEYWQYEVDGTIYQKTKLEKSPQGKLIKSSSYDKEGNLKSYTKTEFDSNGNILKYNTYNTNDELNSIQINEYDSNGNVLSMSRISVASNRTFKTISKYNSKNQLIEETDFKSDGSIKDVRTFMYDENGNEVESELTRANGDYTKFLSKYDENNNLTVQKWYDKDGNQKHQTSFTYMYDKNNNWITKKRYSDGDLGYVWERKIEYK